MEFAFYTSSLIAVLATLRAITHKSPVYALLHLIISLLGVSGVSFSLGASFPGAMGIIVYAGAIMVLFVFVVMMLDPGDIENNQESQWLKLRTWIFPTILSSMLMAAIIMYGILGLTDQNMDGTPINVKTLGITLFGPYVLTVELGSMLLLASLIVAFHIGRGHRAEEGCCVVKNTYQNDSIKRTIEDHR